MKPCVILRFALIPSVTFMYNNYYTVLVAVKEYERVEGWGGSDAVSPRDGAAWTLRNA